MAIPDFNTSGDLPPGIHAAALVEILARFGHGATQRESVARRLQRVYELVSLTECLSRFVIFGSFVTTKPEPNDVDIILVMNDDFDASLLEGEAALIFDHAAADAHFGCSIFWVRRVAALGGVEEMLEYWQVKRGGGVRGIIEVVSQT